MTTIQVKGFSGENRALHPSLLPENIGVTSLNQRPGRGDLRPWNAPLAVSGVSVPTASTTIYRMGRDVASDSNYWLTWAANVHAVRGFNTDDPSERTYYTGHGTPKWTDKARALTSGSFPTASRDLGVPAPRTPCVTTATTPLTVATAIEVSKSYVINAVGTTDFTLIGAANNTPGTIFTATAVGTGSGTVRNNTDLEDRYYVYTYVSDIGEESAPSPPSAMLTCRTDDTVTVNNFASPSSVGIVGINRIRIYKTASGTTGADFYFLKELGTNATINATAMSVGQTYTIATLGTIDFTLLGASGNFMGTTFTCTVIPVSGTGTVSYVTLNLASTTDDNHALSETLPSTAWLPAPGIPQGGASNYVEPTLHHLTGMWNGMMAGISGRSVRICEAFLPYAWPLAYEIRPPETTPIALGKFGQTLVVLTNGKPILAYGGSPDAMDEQPVEFTQACVSDRSVVSMGSAVIWAGPDGLCSIGSSGPNILTAGVMTKDDWQLLNPSSMVASQFDGRYVCSYTVGGVTKGFVVEPGNPGGIFFTDFGFESAYYDEYQDALYIKEKSSSAIKKWNAGTALTCTFKSKEFQFSKPLLGFTTGQVIADAYPATFKLYIDGELKHTRVVTTRNAFRIPTGYRLSKVNIEVVTSNPVQNVAIAHSMDEIAQV
jgi:hypothetical protein